MKVQQSLNQTGESLPIGTMSQRLECLSLSAHARTSHQLWSPWDRCDLGCAPEGSSSHRLNVGAGFYTKVRLLAKAMLSLLHHYIEELGVTALRVICQHEL